MFSFYARQTVANKQYKIWTNDNHPEEIFSQDFFYQKLQYIHENPVRAGIVLEGICKLPQKLYVLKVDKNV